MSAVTIFVTTSTQEEAMKIARTLIKERLAACANILGEISSVYRWNEEVIDEKESALLLKTHSDLTAVLTERIKALHSYECPCITVLEIVDGNADYIAWIAQETSPRVTISDI